MSMGSMGMGSMGNTNNSPVPARVEDQAGDRVQVAGTVRGMGGMGMGGMGMGGMGRARRTIVIRGRETEIEIE